MHLVIHRLYVVHCHLREGLAQRFELIHGVVCVFDFTPSSVVSTSSLGLFDRGRKKCEAVSCSWWTDATSMVTDRRILTCPLYERHVSTLLVSFISSLQSTPGHRTYRTSRWASLKNLREKDGARLLCIQGTASTLVVDNRSGRSS